MKIALLILAVVLTGCQSHRKIRDALPYNTAKSIGATSEAVYRLSEKNREIEKSDAKREASISAFLEASLEVILAQPLTPEMVALKSLVGLARGMSIQIPDVQALSDAREIARLRRENKIDQAEKAESKISLALKKSGEMDMAMRLQRDKFQSELGERIEFLEKEREEALRKNQQAIASLNSELIQVKSSYAQSLQAWTSRILIGIGIAGIVGSGAMIWLTFSVNPILAFKRAAPLVIGSLLSIGCGFIVTQQWFIWAASIAVLIFLIGIFLVVWHGRVTNKTLTATLKKTIQSAEEQQVENPSAAIQFKEFQKNNLDDLEKQLIDKIKSKIDRKYIDKALKKQAEYAASESLKYQNKKL
jgi:hypothetical protein